MKWSADRKPCCALFEEFQDGLGLVGEAVGFNFDAAEKIRALKHEAVVVGNVLGEEKVNEADVAFGDDASVSRADFRVDDERDNDIGLPPGLQDRQDAINRVLVVGWENHGVGKIGFAQAGLECAPHAEVDGVIQCADARVVGRYFAGDIRRPIGAAIVDDENLEIQPGLFGGIRSGAN